MTPEDYDKFTFTDCSLVDDILSDQEQLNLIDCLMVERPLRYDQMDRQVYDRWISPTGDYFYLRLVGLVGKSRVLEAENKSKTFKGRQEALKYCWYKPSMRKMLISWWPSKSVWSKGGVGKSIKIPFHFSLLSTRMFLSPKFKWRKEIYLTQLEQVKQHWELEDDISDLSLQRTNPFLLVTMLEPEHKKEQMEALIEVFGNLNVVFLVVNDHTYLIESRREPKIKRKSKGLTTESAARRNGFGSYYAEDHKTPKQKRVIKGHVKSGHMKGKKLSKEELKKIKEEVFYTNPKLYLVRRIRALFLCIKRWPNSVDRYRKELQETIDRMLEESILSPEEMEEVGWCGIRDEVEINPNKSLNRKILDKLKS